MSAAGNERIDWRLLLACWAVVVVLLAMPHLLHLNTTPHFTDNDDIMRMVTATDLANGQNWQDKVEHRDDAPFGTPMHWSRLVDAPIAGLLLLARPWLGAGAGDAVAFVWPLIMLLGLLVMSVGLTRRLLGAGHQLSALVLPAISIVVLGEFSPYRVDHHNVQMILTTALAWATISGRTSAGGAIVAGLLAATCLAVGIETLPFLAGAVLAFAFFWVNDTAAAANARRFALAFAGGTLAHFLAATAPSLYFVSACDELSDAYVIGVALVAVALCAATAVGGTFDWPLRLLSVGLLGAMAVAATLALFPTCIGGPYSALDGRAANLLLAHVAEAQPLWVRLMQDPVTTVSFVCASFAGIAVLVWCCAVTTGERRIDWLVLLLYLVLATLVAVLQIRGARLAVMPAVPAGAWLIDRARKAYGVRRGTLRALALVASWLAFAGIAQLQVPMLITSVAASTPKARPEATVAASTSRCFAPSAYDRLASLPAGIVIAPTVLGPHILRHTSDAVVAAGYHRNIEGAFDTDDFLNAGEPAARAVVARRGVRYVVVCAGLPQLALTSRAQPGSFIDLWSSGRHWDWLVPASNPADAALQIFQIEWSK